MVDGLQLHTLRPSSADPDVARALTVIDETVDAVADALTAEAVYQIVRGNPLGALTDLEAIAAGAAPPELRFTETPRSGIRLTHRIALVLPANAVAPGWQAGSSPRSRAEPLLDAWCGLVLSPADATVLVVEDTSGATVNVSLAGLGVAAIDIVLAGRNQGSELTELIVRAALRQRASLVDPGVRLDRAWTALTGLCDAAARVMTRGEVLRADVFEPPTAFPAASDEAFGDLPQRVDAALAELLSARNALAIGHAVEAARLTAAGFGIRVPGALIGATPSVEQQDALLAAIESRLAGSGTGTPRERLRTIFGGDLPGVVSFVARDPASLSTTAAPAPDSLLAADRLAPAAWLDAAGRTHARTATLAEVVLRREIATQSPAPLAIAQVPWKNGDRWIATAFTSASRQLPEGRLSVLMHAPAGFDAAAAAGGLLLDAWTDTIPDRARDTAMALRFNNASTRAPQAILLAVNPNLAQPWTTDTLVEVLRQTLTLTRMRALPATTFSRGGLMPWSWLGRRPDNTGISFTL